MTTLRALVRVGAIIILAVSLVLVASCQRRPATTPTTTGTTATGTTDGSGGAPALPAEITGLDSPVGMAFAPDGRVFITERVGRIRVVRDGRLESEPFATVTVPRLLGYHETGLLGIAIPADFQAIPYVYVYHTYEKQGELVNRVVRFRADGAGRPEPEVIIDDIPGGRIHNGGILAFGPNDRLFVSTGETGESRLAQDIASTGGKILRLNADGDIPSDNPFPGSPVYSYGHRNVFGMAIQPVTNTLFITENGPTRNDEINKIEAGENYGWPTVTGRAADDRFVDPVRVYENSIAPTQAVFYTGSRFPEIREALVFGTYNTRELRAVHFAKPANDTVSSDAVVFDFEERVVGVAQAPDGSLYVIGTDTIQRVDRLGRD